MVMAKRRKLVLALYLTIIGIVFGFETIIFCFLKAYNYYPMIIQTSGFDDGLAGNIFSQLSVSITALLIAILNLKYYWYFLFSGIYCVIEELFLALGIYKHHWYRTWMTFVSLILLFWIVKKIYVQALKSIGNVLRYTYIFFGLFTLHTPLITWGSFKLTGYQTFNPNIFPDHVLSYMTLFVINFILLSNTIMIIYFLKLKWRWKMTVIFALYIAYYITYKLNYIYVKDGWFLIFTTAEIFGAYLFVFILDRLYKHANEFKI
jgi:hypothetical protein